MKITFQATGAQLTLETNETAEILLLGRLKEKLPTSHLTTNGTLAVLTLDARDLVKVAATGKL